MVQVSYLGRDYILYSCFIQEIAYYCSEIQQVADQLLYSYCAQKNRRSKMEDRAVLLPSLSLIEPTKVFFVYWRLRLNDKIQFDGI